MADKLRPAYITGAPPDRVDTNASSPARAPSTALWQPHAAVFPAADSPSPSAEQEEDNQTEIYRLSIVRLADAEHAELAYLNATLSSKRSMAVCGGAAAPPGSATANVSGAACVPGAPMWLNVTHDVDWVRHQASTRPVSQPHLQHFST